MVIPKFCFDFVYTGKPTPIDWAVLNVQRACVEVRDLELYVKAWKIADQPLDSCRFRFQIGDMDLLLSDSY
ncbi:hypothetical protein NS274_09210 [Pseudomonas oryzihabitans]|nr:hypothetical protein NS274_09210 [Pseudomonas psychrotolerans]